MVDLFKRWLIGPGAKATVTRYVAAIVTFAAIYAAAFQFPDAAFYLLASGYALVVIVGCWWWHEEKRRVRITRQFDQGNPDSGPDLRGFAVLVVLQLIVLFPWLSWAANRSFDLYSVPQDSPWYSWVLFTVDRFSHVLSEVFDIYGIHLGNVAYKDNAPWGQHLALIKRLTIDFVLVAGIWRGVAIHQDVSQAIRALAYSWEPSVRVGRRAINKLGRILLDKQYAEDVCGENAAVARQNAAKALGRIMEDAGRSSQRGRRIGSGYQKAVNALRSALSNPTGERATRTSAATALGAIGDPDPQVSESLCTTLEAEAENEPYLCTAIVTAIREIRPALAVRTLCTFLVSGTGKIARRYAAQLLGELDDVSAIDRLLSLLDDGDRDLRLAALTALRRLCMKSQAKALHVAEVLRKVIATDDDPEVRTRAKEILDSIREKYRERSVAKPVKSTSSRRGGKRE